MIKKEGVERYRNYYYEDEIGLYYLATRYYDPETCRFVTSNDPRYLGAKGDIIMNLTELVTNPFFYAYDVVRCFQ